MATDMATLFSGPDWGSSSLHSQPLNRSDANFLSFPIPSLHTRDGGYPYTSDIDDTGATIQHKFKTYQSADAAPAAYRGFGQGANLNSVPSRPNYAPSDMYATPAIFTATDTHPTNAHDTQTIEPNRTCFDSSFDSSQSLPGDGAIHSAVSSSFDPWSDTLDDQQPSPKSRRSSAISDLDASSPVPSRATGRRRKSENAEPGSARAIYLEKNRKAASKCRGKQKKQQEDLVETARNFERKNKTLKAEVEFLKSDMRELMELVGKHTHCPDTRLHTYTQRKADRLVAGDTKSPDAVLPSPKANYSPHL